MKFLSTKNRSGFTIIEVMIVLAIAGVIMLALFLAVPALQRNSRNNQRKSDAALFTASVNECLNNRNGAASSCNDHTSATNLDPFVDESKFKQLTVLDSTSTLPTTVTSDTIYYAYGQRCDASGIFTATNATARQFAVVYGIETSGEAIWTCIES